MTPLTKGQQILAQINSFATSQAHILPTNQYVQMGEYVNDCESFVIAVTATVPHVDYGPIDCNASQNSTFKIYLTRSCNWTALRNGTTSIPHVEASAAVLDADGEFLWKFANQFDSYLSKTWTLQYSLLDAGLGSTLLILTTGVD